MKTLSLDRSAVSFGWSRDREPTLVVPSGSELTVDAPECSNGQLGPHATLERFKSMDLAQLDPISGPVYVEGAQPGDVLQVDVLKLDPAGYGWSARLPDWGLLTAEYPDAWWYCWDLTTGERTEFVDDVWVPIEPMIGVAGCTPDLPGVQHSVPPHSGGGNMDMKYLREGTTAFLPVQVEGALFGIGDPHAAQGDGEVGGSGIECPMDITVRLTVIRGRTIHSPEYLVTRPIEREAAAKAGYFVTTGVGSDLFEASQQAVRSMIDRIRLLYEMESVDVYMLCSVALDLKIAEIVNDGTFVVAAFLPRDLFSRRDRGHCARD